MIDTYLTIRKTRFPSWRRGPRSPLFVDLHGEPLRRGGLRYLVDTAMRQAGVGDQRHPGALVHAMRHTFATRLAEDGASAAEIMKLLGHASLNTSQLYIDATAVRAPPVRLGQPHLRSGQNARLHVGGLTPSPSRRPHHKRVGTGGRRSHVRP